MSSIRDREREREREEEEEREREQERARKNKGGISGDSKVLGPAGSLGSGDPLDELMHRATVLIDQVNGLYNMYLNGTEKAVPVQQRKNLENLFTLMQKTPKVNQSASFKFSNLHSRYLTYCDRWDRMMKGLETGKVKRTTKP